jgi:hypothetical protein
MDIISQATSTPFLVKLWAILEEENAAVSWNSNGKSFSVHSTKCIEQDVLPRYFRSNQFTTFQRQLSFYGFKKQSSHRDRYRWQHELFQRSQPELVLLIKRKVNTGNENKKRDRPSGQGSNPTQLEKKINVTVGLPRPVLIWHEPQPTSPGTSAHRLTTPSPPPPGVVVEPAMVKVAEISRTQPTSLLSPRSQEVHNAFCRALQMQEQPKKLALPKEEPPACDVNQWAIHRTEAEFLPVEAPWVMPVARLQWSEQMAGQDQEGGPTASFLARPHVHVQEQATTTLRRPAHMPSLEEVHRRWALDFDADPQLNALSPITPAANTCTPMSWSTLVVENKGCSSLAV